MLIVLDRCFYKRMRLTPRVAMTFWVGFRFDGAGVGASNIPEKWGFLIQFTVLLLVVSGTFLFPVWGVDGGGISAAASTVTLCYLLCVCLCRVNRGVRLPSSVVG